MKQPNLKFLSKSFLFCKLVVSVLAVNIFLSSDVLADSESSNQLCGSEQPSDVACGGTCCEHSNCAGGGEEDCKFCDLQKTCSASACGIRCKDKTACAGGDNNCIFCNPTAGCTNDACGLPCSNNTDCEGGDGECKYCVSGKCLKNACNVVCAKSSDCAGSADACNYCLNSKCNKNACGAQCDSYSDCAGSPDGCNLCNEGKCSQSACGLGCKKRGDCVGGAKNACVICGKSEVCSDKACGANCYANADCAGTIDGCLTCTNLGKCESICGKKCSANTDCAGGEGDCTMCDTSKGECVQPNMCGRPCINDAACAKGIDNCKTCATANAQVDMGQLTSSATACGSDGYYVDYFGNILGKVSALTPVVYSWGDGCRRGKEQNIDAKASWGYSCGTGEGGRYLCKGVQGDIFAMSSNGDVSLAAGCVPKKGVLGTSSAKVCIPSYYKFGNIRVSAYGNAEGQSYVNGKYVGLGNGKTWKAEVETQYGVSPCIRKIDFYVRMCAGMTHGSICCSAMYNNCYVNPNSNLFNKLCGYGQVGDQFAWWNRWYKGNAGYRYVTDSCQVISGAPGTYGLDLKTTYGSPVSLVLEDEPEVSPTITNNFKLNTAQKDHWVIWRASSKRPLVVYDPKKSGKVTAVTQLFGTNTFGKTWRDGFEALASLDKNQDGKVAGDELKDLSLWFDKNQNAVSEKGEVVDLISYGVTELFYSKDGNDVRTADILANKGYTLVKNGKTITGLSIDWFTALYESKSAAQAALEEFKKMQAAAGQQTRSEPKVDAETQAFEGTWRWQIDEKYINAENLERGANTTGLFVLVSGEEGGNSVDGTSTIQVGVEPNSDKVETAVVNFWLENAKTYNEHGVQFLSWTIQDERIGLFSESVAELSEDGTTLYGVSRDDLKDPKTLVRSSRHYTWKAMKLEI